ncbi:UDP-glucose 4-epimerase [Puccinia triticina 1-1 BBBD Race 1]|uniref:NAD(P)-bd_dom domain-containing protein n=1 Tax=Puccinia triticina (isolate 1-1 / race 1 (BBBD)) TaxID=630390 RepID=A0A0C4ELS0_PUCT1|nr:UDP-glucose 4-epimerase [Puccinia triticina 1-1 BBBD Race 1]
MSMSIKPTSAASSRSQLGRRIQKKRASSHRLPRSGTKPVAKKVVVQDWPLILVTGANGYIGSHVVLELLKQGDYGVIAIDSLENSSAESLRRVRELAAQSVGPHPPVYHHQTDIRDRRRLRSIFQGYRFRDGGNAIQHVIHFAALKSVEGSRLNPAGYYSTNVLGTAGLLEVMKSTGVNSLVFSSSAVVYGSSAAPEAHSSTELLAESRCPVRAHQPEGERKANYERITNTYGKTKLMCEELIHKLCYLQGQSKKSADNFRAVILRYTNPSGNDPSGRIGDSPTYPENLMPIAAQVLQGTREQISIYGADYPTRDGTGVRDFIHVQDLAKGHLAALRAFKPKGNKFSRGMYPNNCQTYNLGTGRGASVMEVITALTEASGRPIKTKIAPRRPGDLATVICDPSKAELELGWKAEKGVLENSLQHLQWRRIFGNFASQTLTAYRLQKT